MSLPLALGLYSVRDLYREDFEACLKKVAAIGYTGVECYGPFIQPAGRVTKALSENGLTLVGWHIALESVEGDEFDNTVAYAKAVGCPRLVVPYIDPECFASRAALLKLADRLNAISARLAELGLGFGYHNHDFEFRPLEDGTIPWAVLMDATNIIGQLDNGNAMASKTPGLDTAELIARWPGRATTVHAKPYSHTHGLETMIGEDDIDWSAFLHACEHTGGTEWLIVEYEEPLYEQFEGVALCIHALEKFN